MNLNNLKKEEDPGRIDEAVKSVTELLIDHFSFDEQNEILFKSTQLIIEYRRSRIDQNYKEIQALDSHSADIRKTIDIIPEWNIASQPKSPSRF